VSTYSTTAQIYYIIKGGFMQDLLKSSALHIGDLSLSNMALVLVVLLLLLLVLILLRGIPQAVKAVKK